MKPEVKNIQPSAAAKEGVTLRRKAVLLLRGLKTLRVGVSIVHVSRYVKYVTMKVVNYYEIPKLEKHVQTLTLVFWGIVGTHSEDSNSEWP